MADNTLNDTLYTDPNVTRSLIKEQPGLMPVGNEYDYVLSFFKKIMKDTSAAESFARSLYQVSQTTQIPVTTLLETLAGQDEIKLNESMAYYLNGIRSPSTLLGVQQLVAPNYYAGRNVLI